ncbi:family 43 glycosylhydrolase [Bacteroidota bacterium]
MKYWKILALFMLLIAIFQNANAGLHYFCNPDNIPHSMMEDSSRKTTELISSGNPIITHIRSADPAAEVWNDGQVWVYASHDQDDAEDYSSMQDYHAFSSYDLVNWTDHGVILHAKDVSWGNSSNAWMFAPDAAYKEGMYYLYFPTMSNEWKWRVGVATSDRPEGPFKDIGRYIEGTDEIDPACFMDDDGQAYLIWGGGSSYPRIAKLKENMTELAEEPRVIDYGADNFGEGPYMHKRNGIYYFSYTDNTAWPYQGYYSMADNPYGPFEYKGELKRIPPGAQDHHSVIEYHGQWYYFYHVGNYGTNGSAFRRNICIDSLFYNPDGTMQEVIGTETGVSLDLIGSQAGLLVPGRIEAEDYFREAGTLILQPDDTTRILADIQDGDWVEFVLHVLGTETYRMELSIKNPENGVDIQLSVNDIPIDTIQISENSTLLLDSIFLYKGKHTFKLQFLHPDSGTDLLQLDWINMIGDKKYYSIQSSTSEGGSIYPEGTTYFTNGDSAIFRIDSKPNYILNKVIIDGVEQGISESYSFNNIIEDHSIEAIFVNCWSIPYSTYYQIDDNAETAGKEISITERQDLMLRIDVPDAIEISWTGPDDFFSQDPEIHLDSIRIFQEGSYTATLTNNLGCTEAVSFTVDIESLVLDVFEAEDYFSQAGTSSQPCTDWGEGWNLGSIENNDWSYYTIDIDTGGIYDLTARVATATAGGSIEVSILDSLAARIEVPGSHSNDWQDWFTTTPVEIGLEEGIQRLKFTYKGNDGFLFNFNWFDLEYNRPFERDTSNSTGISILAYPNPVITDSFIEFTLPISSFIELKVLNNLGQTIKILISGELLSPGYHRIYWNVSENNGQTIPHGVYFILLRSNENVLVEKLFL